MIYFCFGWVFFEPKQRKDLQKRENPKKLSKSVRQIAKQQRDERENRKQKDMH